MTKPKTKSDDEIFAAAKTKVGTLLRAATTVDDVCQLANTLCKLKAVEMKGDGDSWGGSLGGDEDPA